MLPSKIKRKLVEDKSTTNGDGKNKSKAAVEAESNESDYESDEVNFVDLKHVLLFTSR